jgi:hypothetical protein
MEKWKKDGMELTTVIMNCFKEGKLSLVEIASTISEESKCML